MPKVNLKNWFQLYRRINDIVADWNKQIHPIFAYRDQHLQFENYRRFGFLRALGKTNGVIEHFWRFIERIQGKMERMNEK